MAHAFFNDIYINQKKQFDVPVYNQTLMARQDTNAFVCEIFYDKIKIINQAHDYFDYYILWTRWADPKSLKSNRKPFLYGTKYIKAYS